MRTRLALFLVPLRSSRGRYGTALAYLPAGGGLAVFSAPWAVPAFLDSESGLPDG